LPIGKIVEEQSTGTDFYVVLFEVRHSLGNLKRTDMKHHDAYD